MLQILLKIFGILILMGGVVMCYDARILTRKWFGFGDQNEASLGLKMLGFIAGIVGALIIIFNK